MMVVNLVYQENIMDLKPDIGSYPFPSSIILVAVLPLQRDLEIARVLGWYRIPFRFAPKIINVDYIAFYQTSAFGISHKWRIEHFAEMRGCELTSRSELFKNEINHPRANEEYYKIQLGPIQKLPHPILSSNWKRITFFYTTGELFRKASSIQDLVIRSDDRELLWKSLRERVSQTQIYQSKEIENLDINPSILKILFDLSMDPEYQKSIEDEKW